jgi:ribonuclease D
VVEEECAALAAQPAVERVVDPNAFARLKGARELPPRYLAVLRELYELREQLARTTDRPPFKILAEETLVRLAQTPPEIRRRWPAIPGCTPKVIARWGRRDFERHRPRALDSGRRVSDARAPAPPSASPGPRLDVSRRFASGARRPRRASGSSPGCSCPTG